MEEAKGVHNGWFGSGQARPESEDADSQLVMVCQGCGAYVLLSQENAAIVSAADAQNVRVVCGHCGRNHLFSSKQLFAGAATEAQARDAVRAAEGFEADVMPADEGSQAEGAEGCEANHPKSLGTDSQFAGADENVA